MKFRNGFISNSSASSFTIYGWSITDLNKHISSLCSFFKDVDIEIDEYSLINKITSFWEGSQFDICSCHNSYNELIVGIGQSGAEIDHYNSDWESFEFDGPSLEKVMALDRFARVFGLPQPKLYQETFFNG